MKTSTEILEGAIDVLNRDGWYQGHLYEYGMDRDAWLDSTLPDPNYREARRRALREAPVCAMGALHRASSGLANVTLVEDAETFAEAVHRLADVVAGINGGDGMIAPWNDDVETTKEDVILVLKRAITGDR